MLKDDAQDIIDQLAADLRNGTGKTISDPAVRALVILHSTAKDDVTTVFEAWAATVKAAGLRKPRFTDDRRTIIRRRLEEYDVDVVVAAVQGWSYSSWHRGENPDRKRYYSLDLLLRNADTVERFAEYTRAAITQQEALGPDRCAICGDTEHKEESCAFT